MLPQIVQTGAPVLRARAAELTPAQLATPEIQTLIATMIEVMRDAPGVGLAAPQIGIPLRVIVLEERTEALNTLPASEVQEKERVAFAARTIVNPVLRVIGAGRAMFFEGCLSVDGFAALVERHHEVLVTGLDEHGAPVSWQVAGWPARILQHEVDHLDGTLYIDRMLTRTFTTVAHVRDRFAGRTIAEIRAELGV
jgi:peptide deformylase